MRLLLFFAALVFSFSSRSAQGTLISGFIENPSNGHRYALVECDSSWTEAESEARAYGGHLATIRNQNEQNWVFVTFGYLNGASRPLFIGLSDRVSEGFYEWISGEPVTYGNWQDGSPNNARTNEDYIYINAPNTATAGGWDDVPSPFLDFSIYGVIELPALAKPTPTPTGNAVLIAKYTRQYHALKKKLAAAKHIQNADRRKKVTRAIQKKMQRLKRLIAAA